MENILPRVMCEYKEDMITAVRPNENGLYELFKVSKRLFDYFCVSVFLFRWCEVILVRDGYPHFLWVVTGDPLL